MDINKQESTYEIMKKIHKSLTNEYKCFLKKHGNLDDAPIIFGELSINATGNILLELLSALPNDEIDCFFKYLKQKLELIKVVNEIYQDDITIH